MISNHKEIKSNYDQNIIKSPQRDVVESRRLNSQRCSIEHCIHGSDFKYGRIHLCDMHNKEILDNLNKSKEKDDDI